MSARGYALFGVLLAMVCSNTTPIFSKLLFAAGWTPLSAYFLVLIMMTVVLSVHEFLALESGGRWGMDRRDVFGTVLTAVTSGILSPTLFFLGLRYVEASDSVLITSVQPFFIVLFAVLFLRERFTHSTMVGGVFLVLGIVVLLWEDLLRAQINVGALLLLASAFFGSMTTIIHKKLVKHRHLDSVVLVRSVISLVIYTGIIAFLEPQAFPLLVQPQNIWLVLGLPVIGFLLPFFFYFRGLRHMKAIEVGFLSVLGPAFGVLLAVAFLGETIAPREILSLLLVVCGIVFINVPLTKWRIVPSRPMLGPLRQ